MADFDGDGHLDLYTGCFEGGVYVMAGKGKGEFAAPVSLLDKSGAVLRIAQFWDEDHWADRPGATFPGELGVSAAAVDWDADGDLDLVLGAYKGKMYLRKNLGTEKQAAYSTEDEPVLAAGKPLLVESGHAMPCVADWDGDGRWDLVSGSDSGAVHWWRNLGATGKPEFGEPVELVPPSTKADGVPGTRTQATVADLDADGKLDLLVGDWRTAMGADATPAHHGYVWWFRRE